MSLAHCDWQIVFFYMDLGSIPRFYWLWRFDRGVNHSNWPMDTQDITSRKLQCVWQISIILTRSAERRFLPLFLQFGFILCCCISSKIYLLQLESNLISIAWFSLTGKMYRGLGEFSKQVKNSWIWMEWIPIVISQWNKISFTVWYLRKIKWQNLSKITLLASILAHQMLC